MADYVEQLSNKQEVEDLVSSGEQQCYRYDIKKAETDLSISFQIFSGMADIVINPESIPDNKDNQAMFTQDAHHQTLIYIDSV